MVYLHCRRLGAHRRCARFNARPRPRRRRRSGPVGADLLAKAHRHRHAAGHRRRRSDRARRRCARRAAPWRRQSPRRGRDRPRPRAPRRCRASSRRRASRKTTRPSPRSLAVIDLRRTFLGGLEHGVRLVLCAYGAASSAEREPASPAIAPSGDHLADDDQHRSGQFGPRRRSRQLVEPAGIGAAVGARGVLDHRDRRRCGEAGLDQPRGDLRRDRAAHIDRDGRAREREAGPAGQRLAVGVVAGGEDQRRRAMSRSVSGISALGRGGEGGGDAGHDVEGDARRAERRHLLAGPAEDQRIARLEADDAVAVPRLARR